jgi:catechol 2,3-dioxygenase-like lactoylglutathione lyase family enzyme
MSRIDKMTTTSRAAHSHIAVVVDDLGRSQRFYEQVFGFESASRSFKGSGPELDQIMGVEGARIEGQFMGLGGFVIELLHYHSGAGAAPVANGPIRGYAHLSFIVRDVSETMKLAESHGGTARYDSLTDVAMGGDGPAAMGFVADPDGNSIELVAHPTDSAAAAHARFLRADSIGWPPSLESP